LIDRWTGGSDGTSVAVPVTGGDPVQPAGGQSSPGDITHDCANVYWTNGGTNDGGVTSAGSVMMLAKP
jgi:hypothetical protein